jgi:cytochrome c peroxidase
MTFAHASNAIAGFFLSKLTFDNSPWDRFLAGNDEAMTPVQLQGAKNFMSARCSVCHNGGALTDNQFHNVAVAQFGPGQGDGPLFNDDFGRARVTGIAADKYKFRTPPLRNVELTAPYGHNGAFFSLREFVAHYSESHLKLQGFDPNGIDENLRGSFLVNAPEVLAQRDTLLQGVVLTPELVDKLMDYMHALTDDAARDLTPLTPARVPSGLRVDRPIVAAVR